MKKLLKNYHLWYIIVVINKLIQEINHEKIK